MTEKENNKTEERVGRTAREAGKNPSDRHLLWLLVSVLFNIGMMFLLFRLFDPVFEGNDDITVVQFANGSCGSFDPHLVYQNYLMGLVLSGLYRMFPAFPWYSWFQFWALCLSFTAVTYVLCCRMRKGAGFGAALLVQSFAAYECYINLQYTKTAGVLAAAGMLLMWHGLWGKSAGTEVGRESTREPGRVLWGSVFAGLLLCVWSILYRYVQFAACAALTAGIPLLMLADAAWMRGSNNLRNRADFSDGATAGGGSGSLGGTGSSVSAGRLFLRFFAAAVILGGIMVGLVRYDRSIYMQDPGWKNYIEYNDARSELMDYGMPKYEEFEKLYTELGISRTAYDLFDTWNSADTAVFSKEVMKKLTAARPVKKPGFSTLKAFVKEVPKGFLKNRIFRCFLVVLGLWLFFGRHDRRALTVLIVEVLLFGALYYYLFLKGRYLYNRVDAGLWMSALLVLLWTWKKEHMTPGRTWFRTVILLCVMVLCTYWQIPGWKGRLSSHGEESRRRRRENRLAMMEISGDMEHLYVSKLGILSAARCSAPFETMPPGMLSNVVTLGGWKVESVPFNAVLQKYGFSDNPYEAVAGTSDHAADVYLLDNDTDSTLAYLREYYNPLAEIEEAGKWNGETILRVVTKEE